MILVDTSVLIDFFKKNDNLSVDKFKYLIKKNIPFGITLQILQEVLQGAKTEEDFFILKDYLKTQIFYHPKKSIETYIKAAELYRKSRQKGITLRSTIDCLIAEIAMEHNLSLLHNDKDFDRMSKLFKLKIY